jgi:hypothetical protein
LFLYYLVYQRFKAGKRFVIDDHLIKYYYDGDGNWFEAIDQTLVFIPNFFSSDLVYFIDAKARQANYFENNVEFGNSCIVLSLSSKTDVINEFKKKSPGQEFFMPVWTELEITEVAKLYPQSTDWKSRFDFFGGNPRYVLFPTFVYGNSPQSIIEEACNRFSIEEITNHMKVFNLDGYSSIHWLVHIKPRFPFTEKTSCFASEKVLDIIIDRKRKEIFKEFDYLFSLRRRFPLLETVLLKSFQALAISLLENGGSFLSRDINNEKKDSHLKISKISIPPLKNKLKPVYYGTFTGYIAESACFGSSLKSVFFKVGFNLENSFDLTSTDMDKSSADLLCWLLPQPIFDRFKNIACSMEQYGLLIDHIE